MAAPPDLATDRRAAPAPAQARRLQRARLATLTSVQLFAATGLVLAAVGLLREPDPVWVALGATGLVALAAAQAAAVWTALTAWVAPATRGRVLLAHGAASVASIGLLGPVAAGEWATWAWAGGAVAGTAPLLLGRRGSAAVAVLTLVVAAAIARLADEPVLEHLATLLSVALATASMCVLPALLWRLLVEVEAGRGAMARLTAADERLRFAREVHDALGHRLTVIALKAELVARVAPRDADRATAEATEVRRLAADALEDVRRSVHGHRAVDLAEQLEAVEQILRSSGVDCSVEQPEQALPPEVAATFAAVVREASTNVLRHSRARWCRVAITRTDGRAALVVANDGAPPRTSGGTGLRGLHDRLAEAGGSLSTRQDDGVFMLEATMELP